MSAHRIASIALGAALLLPAAASAAPQTRIVGARHASVQASAALVRFTARPRSAGFDCRVDNGAWQACRSPAPIAGLTEGIHTVAVRARDSHGRWDRTPARLVIAVAPTADVVLAPQPGPEPQNDAPAVAAEQAPAPAPPATAQQPVVTTPAAAPPAPVVTTPAPVVTTPAAAPPAPAPVVTTPAPAPPAPASTPPVPDPGPLPVDPPGTLFKDTFTGPDAVLTNHYAMWSGDPHAHQSPNYEVESGTLYRKDNTATTGVPTWTQPWSVESTEGSGNDVFRDWTKRSDFGDVSVQMRFRFEGWSEGFAPDWPVKSWDGVKIWLRRQGASGSYALYTAEIARRQGNVIIQKKCTGAADYTLLAQTSANRPPVLNTWETDGGTVMTNPDGSVTVTVIRSGLPVLTAIDRGGNGCGPITNPGRVGVRGDNAQFSFDDFTVGALL